jgi:hypothetical protein
VSVSARLISQANTVDLVSSPESSAGSANHRRAVRRARSDGWTSLGAGASSVVGIVGCQFCQTEPNATVERDQRRPRTRGHIRTGAAADQLCFANVRTASTRPSVVIMDGEVKYDDRLGH